MVHVDILCWFKVYFNKQSIKSNYHYFVRCFLSVDSQDTLEQKNRSEISK